MFQFLQATCVERKAIAPAWWQLTFSIAKSEFQFGPGQFFLARCSAGYLPRVILPQHAGDFFTLLLSPTTDPGLLWLVSRQPGDPLELQGPLGTGFSLPEQAQNLLLVSDNRLLSPLLYQMTLALAAGRAVTLAHGAKRAVELYPAANLPAEVEFAAATRDGSHGHRGPVSDLLPNLLRWADAVCAVGSAELYRTLKQQTALARLGISPGYLQALVTGPLWPCGVGACWGCAVNTTAGPKLACTDGPVFDLAEIEV